MKIALLQQGIMHHVVFSCTTAAPLVALLANSQNSTVHSSKEFSTMHPGSDVSCRLQHTLHGMQLFGRRSI
jgi:hypothetical protein